MPRPPRASALLGVLAVAALGWGCRLETGYAPLVADRPSGQRTASQIELVDGVLERPARRIGLVHAIGRKPLLRLEWALRERAAEAGGDAVIDVRETRRDDAVLPFWLTWVSDGIPEVKRLEGTVVVFTSERPVGHAPGGSGGGRGP